MPPPRQKGCYCDNCFYGRDALAMEAIRLKGRIAINVNRIKELEAALKWIVNCTDSEMGDGDGARTVAEDALNSRAVEFIQEMLGVEVEIKPEMVPVARVEKHTGQFKDMAILVWLGEQPAEGTILYAKRAV